MSNLDKFREQQKMIEELNKKKREMLANAIQQRYACYFHFKMFNFTKKQKRAFLHFAKKN